jgi:hypothetical protein
MVDRNRNEENIGKENKLYEDNLIQAAIEERVTRSMTNKMLTKKICLKTPMAPKTQITCPFKSYLPI